MPTRRKLLNPFALMVFLLSGVLFLAGWLWLSQVSDRVLNSLNQQTGQRFLDKDITFDPWQRRLTVSDIQVEEKGIQLSAQQASLVLNYRHWWGPWLGEKVESISGVELDDASIAIDPALIAFPLPQNIDELSINRGSLAITGIDQLLAFDQLTLAKEEASKIGLLIESRHDGRWNFSGTYEAGKGLLEGEVRLVELPLSAIFKADFFTALATLNGEPVASEHLSGTMSATLSLSWDRPGGLALKGSAEGQSGQLLFSGMSAQWQQWRLDNVQFHASNPAQSTAELSISGLDLQMSGTLASKAYRSQVQLIQTLSSVITSLTINDSRLEIENGHSPWIVEDVNGSLVAEVISGKGKEKDLWTYQASAVLANIGNVRLTGELSGAVNNYDFQLNDARLAGPFNIYSTFAGYNLQGTQFDLSYNSEKRAGQLDISDWQARKASSGSPAFSINLLQALITDKSGKATIPFAINSDKSNTPLPKRIQLTVEQRFRAIVRAPFDYLSHTTGHRLEPVLHHEAGSASLTGRSRENLENLQKVLARRPGLSLLIEVGVSESIDWPELSRYELEEALLELYSATSSTERSEEMTIPPRVRASLLEQMYLATRRHQKIPDVGEQSPGQRVQEAETWLLKHWPKTPDQLKKLQKARYDHLKSETGTGPVELTLSSGPDRTGSQPESVLTLR
ncbi:hypothetical protein [Endozoicomonas sp. SESOKO1]|uniref:DUF748 domain-containing protein n=1 Tax=Endozoicomonas sp. SESOKO1 TaxID=2828742 RepID=UPI00214842F1|nr:hypothetical protein [Endozoicomonas sp. SESOKO1]